MSFGRKTRLLLLTLSILMITSYTSQAEVINKILAYVGDRIITTYDIQNLDPDQYKKLLAIEDNDTRQDTIKEFTSQVMEFLISQSLIEIAASREGIKVTEDEVEQALLDIMERNKLTKEQLEVSLLKENMTMPKYRYQLKNEILNVRVRNQILLPKLIVVERDLRKIADDNPDDYNTSEKYEVRMILTSDKSSMKKVLAEIKNGVTFEEAAKLYSIDATAANGGYMGFLDLTHIGEPMKNALKKGKVGSISDTFSFNGQVGVFDILSYKDKYDFDEETRKQLNEQALEKMFQRNFNAWLERNKETIVVMRNTEKDK